MKKKDLPNEAGNVNWEKLEKESKKGKTNREDNSGYDPEQIEAEKKNLTQQDKSMPYSDDFLADVNLLNKSIGNYRPQKEGVKSQNDDELQKED